MSSEFTANIAFVPLTEGDTLPETLRAALINADGNPDTTMLQNLAPEYAGEYFSRDNDVYDSSVRKDRPDYLEIEMVTNFESNREWAEALSKTFPTVRLALRGDDDDNAYSEYYLLEGGQYRRNSVHNEPNLEHLNKIVQVWGEHDFIGSWTGHLLDKIEYGHMYGAGHFNANIRSVLKAKSASTGLLASMQGLKLTPTQEAMLRTHPNYDPDFTPNPNWWLGK